LAPQSALSALPEKSNTGEIYLFSPKIPLPLPAAVPGTLFECQTCAVDTTSDIPEPARAG
jgi:hypothetical protein